MVNLLKLCLAGLRGEETEAAMVNYLIPTVETSQIKIQAQKNTKVCLFEEMTNSSIPSE